MSVYIRIAQVKNKLYRVKRWGDPVLVKQAGLSVDIVGTTNFQAVGLYNKVTGWGGVTNFLNIPRRDIDRLIALQVEDNYEDKVADWRSQKMNWLCKTKGTIYFTGGAADWKTAQSIRWGTIAIGGNVVQIEGVEDMLIATRGETRKQWRPMARLAGFRKTDWARPLPELLEQGLAHRCYCSYFPNDTFGDSPKGIIYSPFWNPLDWLFIGPSKPQPKAFYLPMDWLED
jgi:hypothetical protein